MWRNDKLFRSIKSLFRKGYDLWVFLHVVIWAYVTSAEPEEMA